MLALLIDGLNLVRRVYAAVPGEEGSSEHLDGVVQSCTRSLRRSLDDLSPTHAICVFDGPGPSWRHRLWPAYKANRPAMPAPLAGLLERIEAEFEAAGVRSVRVPEYEADDVLASISAKIAQRGGRSIILSNDKSMLTLLRDGVRVRNHFEDIELDESHVRTRFGVAPSALADYLALVGESSHNVPGVTSVGPKTARRLLSEHGSLRAILEAAPEFPGRLGAALREGAQDARLSLQLVTLRTDVDAGVNLSQFRVP